MRNFNVRRILRFHQTSSGRGEELQKFRDVDGGVVRMVPAGSGYVGFGQWPVSLVPAAPQASLRFVRNSPDRRGHTCVGPSNRDQDGGPSGSSARTGATRMRCRQRLRTDCHQQRRIGLFADIGRSEDGRERAGRPQLLVECCIQTSARARDCLRRAPVKTQVKLDLAELSHKSVRQPSSRN